ncbi:Fc receptor-like protein 5 [Pagrus major]|uniref:Fc receptor-like protein 5 n=1 Tax=Pagrus major TaxID=143350 RepID=UPI003CC8606A
MRNIKGTDTICNVRVEITGSCTITTAFTTDSGEYWCEAEGKKSNSVNIIVTAGPVILESPALPVKEGEDVTLQCRNKTTPSKFTAYFYKNGLLLGSNSTGEMTIHNVSKSDEGLYKCNISGVAESPESRLVVGDQSLTAQAVYTLSTVINLLLMLVAQVKVCSYAQIAYGVFPRVVPTRLQYFEYEHISFYCEGFQRSPGWRLMKNISSKNTSCGTSWGFLNESVCIIRDVYVDDSGEYWCETGEGEKSETVTISVTAGSLILETPVHPVMEGDHVTLHCKTKTPSSNISASFYKDDVLIRNSATGDMKIQNVKKCDEGVYKCSISGVGESPESQLTVTEYHRGTIPFCSDQLPVLLYSLIKTVSTVFCVALLLLVLRKRDSGKHRVSVTLTDPVNSNRSVSAAL